jgi:hypothetical protein
MRAFCRNKLGLHYVQRIRFLQEEQCDALRRTKPWQMHLKNSSPLGFVYPARVGRHTSDSASLGLRAGAQ